MAQHYDVALIGGDVSQLVAALMLARKGRRVAVVEHELLCPVDARRALLYVGEMSCIARCHDELGITPPPTLRVKNRSPWQVILPGHRLTLAGGRQGVAQEFKRAFPDQHHAIDDLLQQLSQEDRAICHFLQAAPSLPPESPWERLALWRAARALRPIVAPETGDERARPLTPLPSGHVLQRLVTHGLPLLQHGLLGPTHRLAAAHLLGQVLLGHPADVPTRADLVQLLWDAAQRAGIDARRGARIKHMAQVGRRITHLELQEERQELRAEYYVYGGRGPLGQLCGGGSDASGQSAADAAWTALQGQGGQLLQRQWQLPTRCLNQALGPRVWHLDGRGTGRGGEARDEPFVLQREDDGDLSTLTITWPVQDASARPQPAQTGPVDVTAAPWAQASWQRIEPRLKRTVPHVPQDGAGLGPLWQGAHRQFVLPASSYLGVTGRSRTRALRNVVGCGREVVPGLGLEGEYLAAAGSVALLSRRAGWR